MFLPFTPAHSYLSKDRPFPTWGPQPSRLPQGLVWRATGISASEPLGEGLW